MVIVNPYHRSLSSFIKLKTNLDDFQTINNGRICTERGYCTALDRIGPEAFSIILDFSARFAFADIDAEELRIIGVGSLMTDSCKFKYLYISAREDSRITLSNDSIDDCVYYGSSEMFDISNTHIKKLSLRNFSIKEINAYSLQPDTLICEKLFLANNQSVFDLTQFANPSSKETLLSASIDDLAKFKLNYINNRISFEDMIPGFVGDYQREISIKQSAYRILIDMQRQYGFTEGEEKADREFKEFEYTKDGNFIGVFGNWLDKVWWDYGYNKQLIIRNTLFLFLIIYILNLFIYNKLVHDVYSIDEFVKYDIRRRKKSFTWAYLYAFYCFLHTAFIFFGLKLDFGAIRIKHRSFAIFIFLQAILGTLCIASIVGFILTK